MKKPFLIIMALFCVITGCKIDEAGLPKKSSATTSGSLVGMWFIKTQITVGTALGMPINSTSTGFTNQDYYIFNSDKTFKTSDATSTPTEVSTGSYTYANRLLTLSNADGIGTFTIDKLTADSLIMHTSVSVPALATATDVTLKLAHQ
jgi:hypothetical protein